jgi:alpha,alpha-trehalase
MVESTLEAVGPRIDELKALADRYTGAIFERKSFSANLHYRLIDEADRAALENELANLSTEGLKVRWSKKSYEVSPQVDWHKGSVCLAIMRALHAEESLPVYIGDDLTDEDAFATLGHGITIRVGHDDTSKAQYYINDQEEIVQVLEWLIEKASQAAKRQKE